MENDDNFETYVDNILKRLSAILLNLYKNYTDLTDRQWVEEIPSMLQHIKEQTEEICLAALQKDGLSLKYVKVQTPEMCRVAVQEIGLALLYVREQTPELCLAAVKQRGDALDAVREQTDDICLAAVQQDGMALKFVKKQTEAICLAAMKQNVNAIVFVDKQILNSIPFRYNHFENVTDITTTELCCICLEYDSNEFLISSCKHYFHKTCINECLKSKRVCPYCRANVSFIMD
jgi:hypothetical protein